MTKVSNTVGTSLSRDPPVNASHLACQDGGTNWNRGRRNQVYGDDEIGTYTDGRD